MAKQAAKKTKKSGGKEPAKMGAPIKEVNLEVIAEMCRIHMTNQEIADVSCMSIPTLYKAIERHDDVVSYKDFFREHRAGGKQSLRRFMFDSAENGNFQAQQFLSKNYMGMSDKTISVIEGDQQTLNDANRIHATGAPVIQINTGNGCLGCVF